MKKKMISLLIALVCAISFPVAALADTWVDDSSYPGGGYWIDDEGYMIDNSAPAPAPSTPLVKGKDEPDYSKKTVTKSTANAKVAEDAATSGSISARVSTDPSALQFDVTANGEVTFKFYVGSSEVTPSYSYENGVLSVYDPQSRYYVSLYSANGTSFGGASSYNEHAYTIEYNLDGQVVTVVESSIAMGDDGETYTAPLTYASDNLEYELVGGENAQTQVLSYGKEKYTFYYEVFNPEDLTATIEYVDERDNRLDYYTFTLSYNGGEVYQDLPATIEKDGRTYAKVDNTSRITFNYFSQTLHYTIRYREVQPVNTQPYTVRVNYVDAETGVTIGGDYFNITAQNIADDAMVTLGLAQEIAYYTGSSVVYYQPESVTSISHPAADNSTLVYTVKYVKMAEDAPYTWSVRLVDIATGDVLSTVNYPVTVSSSATHQTQSQITVNGVRYLLASSMENEYVHNYGDANRVQYIYYNAEGSAETVSYEINVRYMEIGGNTELQSATYTVNAADESLTIPTEETLTANGVEYVRLLGQEDISHDFYSPQRNYTVYYRDVNDEQNADVVIVREETITTETTVTGDTTTVAEGEETTEEIPDEEAPLAPAVEGEGEQTTVIQDPEGEDDRLVDENGDDYSDLAEEEIIEDSEAPQAAAPVTNQGEGQQAASNSWIWITVIILAVVAAAVIIIIAVRKKTKAN